MSEITEKQTYLLLFRPDPGGRTTRRGGVPVEGVEFKAPRISKLSCERDDSREVTALPKRSRIIELDGERLRDCAEIQVGDHDRSGAELEVLGFTNDEVGKAR